MATIYLLFTVILLFLSAFFSSSETALFSLDKLKLEEIIVKHQKRGKLIVELLKNPRRLLIGILIGNTLVNVTASIVAGSLMVDLFDNTGTVLMLAIIIMTLLLLIIGEITPKMYAISHNVSLSLLIARPINLFLKFIYPIRKIFRFFTDVLLPSELEGEENLQAVLSEEEFRTLVKVTENEGIIGKKEGEILKNIFELNEIKADNVMTPRMDVMAIDLNMEQHLLIQALKKFKHRRLPVYKGSIDTIVGKIETKRYLLEQPDKVEKILEPILFIPEEKRITDLIKEFKDNKQNIAVVVDEYGGTSGIVTLEDLVEEIVGEIFDEFDERETLFYQITPTRYRVRGKMRVVDLNDLLGISLPEDEGDTVNGFLLSQFGRFPRKREKLEYENVEFQIEKINPVKIAEVIVEIKKEHQ